MDPDPFLKKYGPEQDTSRQDDQPESQACIPGIGVDGLNATDDKGNCEYSAQTQI